MTNPGAESKVEHGNESNAYNVGLLNKDQPTELPRLRALEKWLDPGTQAMLDRLPLRDDWRCLEMGAGAGSMAYWLAERCPRGRVVAAELDPRYLDASRASNLDIDPVNLVQAEYPKGSFDFIHERLVLSHIPERDDILRRAVEWLAPGGSILIEDLYILSLDQVGDRALRQYSECAIRGFSEHGFDPHWARRIDAYLAGLGLGDLHVQITPGAFGNGHLFHEMWKVGLEQMLSGFTARKWMTEEEAAAIRSVMAAGQVIETVCLIVSVSGRRL